MHLWFAYLFEQRMNTNGFVQCFECNKPLHESQYKDLSMCYSHILSKKLFPQFAGEAWNVQICCPDCHTLYSMRPTKATNQYNLYLKLKEEKHVSST